jgi:hypothetical protein
VRTQGSRDRGNQSPSASKQEQEVREEPGGPEEVKTRREAKGLDRKKSRGCPSSRFLW